MPTSMIDSHDFEMVDKPDSPKDHSPSTNEDNSSGNERSVKALFDTGDKAPTVHLVARFMVITSLPCVLAWTTLSALFNFYRLDKSWANDSDEEMIQFVSQYLQVTMNRCNKRLQWVDEHLLSVLERSVMGPANLDQQLIHGIRYRCNAVSISSDVVGDANWPLLTKTLLKGACYALIAMSFLLADTLLPFMCPIFGWGHMYLFGYGVRLCIGS